MRLFKTLFAATLILLTVVACGSSNNNDPEVIIPENPKEVTVENIAAKWVMTDANSPFKSFEFNSSGNYIITKKGSQKATNEKDQIYYGSFFIESVETMKIYNMGTITRTGLSDKEFKFVFTDEAGNKTTLSAQRAEEMTTTTRTDLLCKTWEIISIDGASVLDTEDQNATVIFSIAGTYFVSRPNDTQDPGGLARWKWVAGSNETKMMYSWDEGTTFDEENTVTIEELTADKLVIKEEHQDGDKVYTSRYELWPTNRPVICFSFPNIQKRMLGK